MLKYYNDHDYDGNKWNIRAAQAYPIVVACAAEHRLTSYGEIADKLGFNGAGMMGKIMGRICGWCHKNDLPSLNTIVVNQETGRPEWSLEDDEDVNPTQMKVMRLNWYEFEGPSPKDFEDPVDLEEVKKARKTKAAA
jgi:putative restriction endonuclease